MTPGEMYTVTPHRMPHGLDCGTWHCLIIGTPRAGIVCVAEIIQDPDAQPKAGLIGPPAPAGWRRRMMTSVFIDALRPLAVDVDLFGSPVGGAR